MDDRPLIDEGLLPLIAERLAVIGQDARLTLVLQLAGGPATPQELADTLGLTQQNVSKHLQILHRNGVLKRTPDGAHVIYALADPSVIRLIEEAARGVIEHLRAMSQLATSRERE